MQVRAASRRYKAPGGSLLEQCCDRHRPTNSHQVEFSVSDAGDECRPLVGSKPKDWPLASVFGVPNGNHAVDNGDLYTTIGDAMPTFAPICTSKI
jgi:hypothetical protein